jgi:hypothetical protein
LFLFVMHACACHAFNATQVLGFRCAVLAPTGGAIQNLKCYKDILEVSHRPVETTQAALDAMQPAAQASSAAEVEETSSEETSSEEGDASDTAEEAENARKAGEERALVAAEKKASAAARRRSFEALKARFVGGRGG